MPKLIEVTIKFRYKKEKGKDEQYYKDKAFDEIYNGDDDLYTDGFEVEEVKGDQYAD